ncbi:MAG: hypothetical protein FWC00_01600 [Firmicutes bacterium]|nr:hypothetical protein [Bacillota bacterium]
MKYFGTDGIRGVFGNGLTIEIVQKLALAIVSFKPKKVLIGRDTRESGPQIVLAIKDILHENNIKVVDVGIVPTSAVSFLTPKYGCDFGLMITASHNPPEHNGIKVVGKDGKKIDGDALVQFDTLVGKQVVLNKDLSNPWKDFLVNRFKDDFKGKKLPHLAIDFANGSGAQTAIDVLGRLGFKLDVYSNGEDEINKNCGSSLLAKELKTKPVDVSFTFDGDADRCLVLDGDGTEIPGDVMLGAYAVYMKAKCLVSTVMFNGGVEEYLLGKGIQTVRTPVGERHVIAELTRNIKQIKDYPVGGEPNGHFIFPQTIMSDDALVVVLVTLKILVQSGKTIKQLTSGIPMWHSELLNTTKDIDKKKHGAYIQDGCRVLVRKSGTENLTRIYVEGSSAKKVSQVVKNLHK